VATPTATNPLGFNTGTLTTVLEVGLACLVVAVLLAGLIIFLIVRRQNRSRK
jgi:preprotein translocase subunit YajC